MLPKTGQRVFDGKQGRLNAKSSHSALCRWIARLHRSFDPAFSLNRFPCSPCLVAGAVWINDLADIDPEARLEKCRAAIHFLSKDIPFFVEIATHPNVVIPDARQQKDQRPASRFIRLRCYHSL